METTSRSELADRIAAAFGYVPVTEALSQSEFEVQLAALTTDAEHRANIREAAIVVAKLGATAEDVAEALVARSQCRFRGECDLRRVQRYIEQIISDGGHV